MYEIVSQNIANLCKSTIDGRKDNSTMVSNTSPGTAAPKMNKYFVLMAHVSSNRACAQDGYLKHPHLTIIDRDMRWDSGWVLSGFWCWGRLDTWLARRKLGKKKTSQLWQQSSPYGPHSALLPAPLHTAISQHAV
jgi:hypothetical protein